MTRQSTLDDVHLLAPIDADMGRAEIRRRVRAALTPKNQAAYIKEMRKREKQQRLMEECDANAEIISACKADALRLRPGQPLEPSPYVYPDREIRDDAPSGGKVGLNAPRRRRVESHAVRGSAGRRVVASSIPTPAASVIVAFVQSAVTDAEAASWTRVEEDRNDDGTSTAPTDVMASSSRVDSLVRRDLWTITRGTRWLSDTIIDAYLAILQVGDLVMHPCDPQFTSLSS